MSIFLVVELMTQDYQGLNKKGEWLRNANQIFLSVILMVLLAKIHSSGRILKQLNSRILSFYPVGNLTILSFNLLEGLVDRWYMAFAGIMLGFMFGAASIGDIAIIAPALILILTNVIVLHLFLETLDSVLELYFSLSRKLKYAIPVVVILGGLWLFNGSVSSLRTLFTTVFQYSPIAWMNKTVYSFAFEGGSFDVALRSIFYTLIAILLSSLIFLTMYQFLANPRFESLTNLKSEQRKTRRPLVDKLLYFFLPRGIAPYALKDLRYLLRSRRTLLMFFLEFGWLVFVFYFFGRNEAVPLRPSILIFFLSFFPVVFWDTYLANSYGMELSAFRSYLSMPTEGRNIVLAKNVSFVLMKTPFILIGWSIFLSFFSPSLLPFLIAAQLVVLCLSLISGNVNSLRYPHPIQRNGRLLSSPPSQNVSLLGFGVLILCLVVPVAIGLMLWMLGDRMGSYALLFILSIFVFYIYHRTLPIASKMFTERGELIYRILERQ